MKKITTIIAALVFFPLFVESLWAGENFKLRVEGPEARYNMVRVTNNSSLPSLDCTVYLLSKDGEKYTVRSSVGFFRTNGSGDTDSKKFDLNRGDWLGVALPDGIENVSCVISYLDLPIWDIVEITIINVSGGAYSVGQEF